MSKIIIETLSPIHIGSGDLLQNNTDFVVSKHGKESYIYVTEEAKILELIGSEHIDNWLLSIEKKESTVELVKRYAPNALPADYSQRQVFCYATGIKTDETLKETIHNGQGLPYIPGSSIKGAIRTAVLTSFVDIVRDKEDKIIQKRRIKKEGQQPLEVPKLDKNNNKLLYADIIEKELFGSDPNSDIFRFIRVGDAYFDKNSTIATRMINLNITHKDNLFDISKPQLIEAIGNEETSTFSLNVTADYYKWVKSKFPTLGNLPAELQSISGLFSLINMHTQKLIEDEIEYWKNVETTGAEYYIETLEDLLEEVKECRNESSCVLRIGHGSGWRFITGAWTEQLSNFKTDVINAARPQNYRYSEYDFPKTRRVDEDSYVLGFVKLTMESKDEY